MLILSRKSGEKIMIGGDIELVVISVRGRRVRLGLTAPPTVRLDRPEVNERRQSRCPSAHAEATAME